VVPSSLGRLLQDEDPMKAQRVMETMLEMQKIDIAELERASAGAHTSPATAD
jgi:predicted 3-demethylubiquinone-9 3-methyltransferase (glyoxalase superfamily)